MIAKVGIQSMILGWGADQVIRHSVQLSTKQRFILLYSYCIQVCCHNNADISLDNIPSLLHVQPCSSVSNVHTEETSTLRPQLLFVVHIHQLTSSFHWLFRKALLDLIILEKVTSSRSLKVRLLWCQKWGNVLPEPVSPKSLCLHKTSSPQSSEIYSQTNVHRTANNNLFLFMKVPIIFF